MAKSPTNYSPRRSRGEPTVRKQSRESADDRVVCASDLAQMGYCERLMVFEHLYGSRRTAGQQRARARGLVEHEQFYGEGRAASAQTARTGRTCVFGEAWQTEAVRPSAWGRRVIRLYYRGAPCICVVLRRWLLSQIRLRMVLGAIATGLLRWLGLRGDGKCRR